MAKVFLSYRRADPLPNWQVKRIGAMCAECGFEEVFVDRDTGKIPPGSNYRDEIEKAIRASDVLLVLIGDRWQSLLDQKGDDPNDMVQLEIRLGLELKKTVVPLLLGGTMPSLEDLPKLLQEFHYCNGQSFEPDTMDSLLPLLLKGLVGTSEAEPVPVVTPSLPQPEPVAANPLQDYAAKAQQRAEEEALRQQRLAERQQSWGEQFEQFQELRQNPHLNVEEVREALQTLCRHWEVEFPADWDGNTDLITEWDGDQPIVSISRLDSKRVYVGNLDYEVTEGDLFDLFNGGGKVQMAEVVCHPRTQRSKGYAYVEMSTAAEARRVVEALHDQEFFGKKLTVSLTESAN